MRHIAIVMGLLSALAAHAQWTVVNLHPPGAVRSGASGVRDGKQIGTVDGEAGIWTGTAGSWISLHPKGQTSSNGMGVFGSTQAGFVSVNFLHRASLWNGTPQSLVDLHPGHVGATQSGCEDISGNQQVGSVVVNGVGLASLWTGTSASWVSLHPAGSSNSLATDVEAGVQVGYSYHGSWHAGKWEGSAASWVDLNPPGIGESRCLGVGDGQQVGDALVNGTTHASLWTGTATSWIDLHPVGVQGSLAAAVDGGLQVGNVVVTFPFNRASLWYGTSGSWVDLHTFLPEQSLGSDAYDIWQNGSFTYIVGGYHNPVTNGDEAVMWVSRMVPPASYTPVRGIVTGGNLASLLNSDDNRLVIRPGIVFTTGEPPVQIRVDATAPAAFPNGLAFSVESSATFGNAQQKIWLWNYVINDYELVDTRLATMTDDVNNVIVRTNSSRFIQPGTLAIRALVSYKAIGPAFAYPWSARIDKAWWTFPG